MTSQIISNRYISRPGAIGSRILAAVFLIYFAPVMLVVAILIKLEAGGPILARRSRCFSPNGLVNLWEFRTVALAKGGSAPSSADGCTALGTFLRVSRLDHLPRLVNMVRGEVPFGLLFR